MLILECEGNIFRTARAIIDANHFEGLTMTERQVRSCVRIPYKGFLICFSRGIVFFFLANLHLVLHLTDCSCGLQKESIYCLTEFITISIKAGCTTETGTQTFGRAGYTLTHFQTVIEMVYDLPANIHVAIPERRIGILERGLQILRAACNKRGVMTDNFRKNDSKMISAKFQA